MLVLALAVPGALAPELQHYLHPCEADGSGQHDTRAAQGGWHSSRHKNHPTVDMPAHALCPGSYHRVRRAIDRVVLPQMQAC